MPNIQDIKKTSKFKKREYRPYNADGNQLDDLLESIKENASSESVIDIDIDELQNWEMHDRPENELGDIEKLAEEMKTMGQIQPCIVRPINIASNTKIKYELIAGERRWLAAKFASIKLKVLVKDLSDNEAALIQVSENSSRKDLSDYAKGMSYAKLREKGILTQSDLTDKLKISKQQVSRLLSFRNIPQEIIEAIGDMSKVSARTAEQIKQLSSKGDDYIDIIKKYALQISQGNVGQFKLLKLVEKQIDKEYVQKDTNKVFSKRGQHLYTWTFDGQVSSIRFAQHISDKIHRKESKKEVLCKILTEALDQL